MFKAIHKVLSVVAIVVLMTSCARDLASTTYTGDSTFNLTMTGKIISVRQVTIKNSDKLSDNTTGAMSGGVLGGVAASGVGKGSGQGTAIVAGAIAGGVIGAIAEGQLGKSAGYEYIIKVDTKNLKSDYYEGTTAMRNAISSAYTSGLITIVQGNDIILSKGQDVYVIFSDKRTRVIAAN